MKKLVVALLMMTLVFSGCGGDTQNDNNNGNNVIKRTSTPKPDPLTIDETKLSNDYIIEEVTEDNTKEGFESVLKYPKVSKMADSDLEARINKTITKRIEEYKEIAGLMGGALDEDSEGVNQVLNVSYEVAFRSEYTFSIKLILENYIVELEEPDEIIESYNFDLRNGMQYELEDMISDMSKLDSLLVKEVQESGVSLLKEIESVEDVGGFFIRESGLVLYVQTLQYTTPDIGPLEFEVSYDDIKDIVKDSKVWGK